MTTATFQARLEDLAAVGSFIEKAIRPAGLNETTAYAIQLAVDEACSNIIEHAYQNQGGKILCTCEVNPEAVTIILQDWGKPFTPTQINPPDYRKTATRNNFRGLGLFFIYRMMDEVKFETPPEGGNILTMVKLTKRERAD